MSGSLVFLSWQRSGIYALASLPAGPQARLQGSIQLDLAERDGNELRSRNVDFEIMGPGDVSAINASAFRRLMPPPNSGNAETNKCVHVELNSVDLPWRYSPELPDGDSLRPWFVLVVGTAPLAGVDDGEIEILGDNQVRLQPAVLDAHPLDDAGHWAHVQIELANYHDPLTNLQQLIDTEGGPPVARLLSPRVLTADREHFAAIVPTFAADGSLNWIDGSGGPVVVPLYYHWKFRAGPGGDFRTLASRLHTGPIDPENGQAPFDYDREPLGLDMRVRGALGPIAGSDAPADPTVTADTAQLTAPLTDPRGRPIIAPPVYGNAWVENARTDPAGWGVAVNDDPRHRGVAGLGAHGGIALQETIVEAISEQAGAVAAANQRIVHLTMGLKAAGSLWEQRLPQDDAAQPSRAGQRLLLYGPTMRRMVTPNGTVLDHVCGPERTLAPALFSSAARRILRNGPARTALIQPGANDPEMIIVSANTCPPLPERTVPGMPHWDDFLNSGFNDPFLPPLEEILEIGMANFDPELLIEFLEQQFQQMSPTAQQMLYEPNPVTGISFVDELYDCIRSGGPINFTWLTMLLRLLWEEQFEILADIIGGFRCSDVILDQQDETEPPDMDGFDEPPVRPCIPVDIEGLDDVLTDAIDPTGNDPWIKDVVLDTIDGLDDQDLAPVEVCTGLDLPTWRFLRDQYPDWLLPGVGLLEEDGVYAFEANPTFVDAFLLGINNQTLAELRWRNIPIASGCTPLKMFWGRIAEGTFDIRENDLIDVGLWPDDSPLGHAAHRPAGVAGTNMVLVIRGDIFRRYPDTLVSAVLNPDAPLFDPFNPPAEDADREWPIFQGSIGDDVTFFGFAITTQQARDYWLVLEEPSAGYRFRSEPNGDPFQPAFDGATFASTRLNDPTRVLISGAELIPE